MSIKSFILKTHTNILIFYFYFIFVNKIGFIRDNRFVNALYFINKKLKYIWLL